ncbi:hypothetical protein [Roseimicrobium sp. ORNL1]|uniref:hypothetical protein n=1 Tax=Roseimicrobium sp. ORNL1 TaxID=2711231 RepID=UPI0013E1762C|nr:hypothetical protein [Roseimicrobium sp. ORNL1]QIF05701.1 hypothetical protein G5S37_30775 [Roseimicrobium sp. ORNL1]
MNHPLTALFLVMLCTLAGAADEPRPYSRDVAKWIEVTPPPNPSDDYSNFMYRANWSTDEWVVSQVDGKVRAVLKADRDNESQTARPDFPMSASVGGGDARYEPTLVLRTDDGWLAAYNRGEFGSVLWWYSLDGKTKYQISKSRVNQFIRHKNRFFAVEGLAHMGYSEGSLIELVKRSGKWTVTQFVELPNSGEAISVLPDDRFCVVTSDMLLAVSLEKHMEILLPNARWGGLYPNSVTTDGEGRNIYIGMRQFVVRYELADKEHRTHLLVPAHSFLNKKTY